MKKILIFTLFGPLLGVIPIFAILVSKSYDRGFIADLESFSVMSLYSFQFGIIPAFMTGLLAQRLDFYKLLSILYCVIFAVCISAIFIRLLMGNDYLLLVFSILASFFSALIISIFIKWRGY